MHKHNQGGIALGAPALQIKQPLTLNRCHYNPACHETELHQTRELMFFSFYFLLFEIEMPGGEAKPSCDTGAMTSSYEYTSRTSAEARRRGGEHRPMF